MPKLVIEITDSRAVEDALWRAQHLPANGHDVTYEGRGYLNATVKVIDDDGTIYMCS